MVSRRTFWLVLIFVIILQAIPFAAALSRSAEGLVFGGFVMNPMDGNSYLAKMQLGFSGEWKFHLLYSAGSGDGAFIFLFYILLGHIARILSMPVVLVFHISRILAGFLLAFSIARFFGLCFKENPRIADTAYVLAMTGGGLGWAMLFNGYLSADIWVAEGYPYLSMLVNPHFPVGLAIILWLVQPEKDTWLGNHVWLRPILGLLLSIIQPFGIVVAGVVMGVVALWRWIEERRLYVAELIWSMALGVPWLVYQYIAIQSDIVLAKWNAQNVTPAPPVWDLVLSLSPAILFSAIGGYYLWRERSSTGRRTLIAWVISAVVMIYLPFSLQRRFMTGLYVPVAGLAVFGIAMLADVIRKRMRWLLPVVLVISVMTNLIMVLITSAGVMGNETGQLFMTTAESQALVWVRHNTPTGALVLASPQMGMFIPAQTGRRTVVGHEFETIDFENEERLIQAYLSAGMTSLETKEYLQARQVNYLFYGSREQVLGKPAELDSYRLVYEKDGVQIYSISP